ncbi:MAG: hypothetical protein R3332_12660, partial [Pseudohongiellaceae bacterium]|nr:hypothetical protein [Pseudohongiellaceae bacterium]
MQRETHSKRNNLITVMAIIAIGMALSSLVTMQFAKSAQRAWQLSAIADAQRLSAELRYRVEREQEPLVAASVLFFGSTEVTFDELQAARSRLIQFGSLNFPLAFAFILKSAHKDQYISEFGIGSTSFLPSGEGVPIDERLKHSVNLALNNPAELMTGVLIADGPETLLPLTMAVPNGQREGVLLYLVDFT